MFSWICVWINGWVNNREAGDLRRHRGHYDVNVMYNGASSGMRLLTTGLPQGSILGPLLSIIYVNDVHFLDNKLNFILYADDATLTSPLWSITYGGYNDINSVSTLISSEIKRISDWFWISKLFWNANKPNSWFSAATKKWLLNGKCHELKLPIPWLKGWRNLIFLDWR